jgi:hypothetical protein
MKSTFLSLNWRDFIKGLIVAVLTPIIPIVQQSITAGTLILDWHVIGLAAAGGFVAYIVKNFFTDSTKEAVKTLSKQNVTVIERSPQAVPKHL